MDQPDVDHMLAQCITQSPARPEDIARVEASLSRELPKDYVEFLMRSNGIGGAVGRSFLYLHSVDKIPEATADLMLDRFLPGCICIGSSGTGWGYAIRYVKNRNAEYVSFAHDSMSEETLEICGEHFRDFIRFIYEDRSRYAS